MTDQSTSSSGAIGSPLDEYREASANVRHYSTVRAAQLTIFVTITSGLLVIFFTGEGEAWALARTWAPVLGIALVVVFMILDSRVQDYFQAAKKRAVELEKGTTYSLYSSVPERAWLHGRTATWLLFLGISILWLVALLFPPER